MLHTIHNHHMAKSFVSSMILASAILNFQSSASYLPLLGREGPPMEVSFGFFKAIQDLERLRDSMEAPEYEVVYDVEPYYPQVGGGSVPFSSASNFAFSYEEPEYVNVEEPENVDFQEVEDQVMELVEGMNEGEIEDFTDEMSQDPMLMMVFLQMLDNKLVDKFNEDVVLENAVVAEENELLGVISEVENLAEDMQEKEEEEESEEELYPAYVVYEPHKRSMVLSREGQMPKRWAVW